MDSMDAEDAKESLMKGATCRPCAQQPRHQHDTELQGAKTKCTCGACSPMQRRPSFSTNKPAEIPKKPLEQPRPRAAVDEEKSRSVQMLEHMLLVQQTRSDLLQTKLDAAMVENSQLRLMMADERHAMLERYRTLQRMIGQHLEKCPYQEPIVSPSSCRSIESMGSFGIPQASFEEADHPCNEEMRSDARLVTPSEERRLVNAPENLPTASNLLLSLSEYQDESQETTNGSNIQANECHSAREEAVNRSLEAKTTWESIVSQRACVPCEIQIQHLDLEKDTDLDADQEEALF